MKRTVLVIEDEPGILDFLEHGLQAQGFEVLSASDGEAGLELALRAGVDLAVLDLMLPGRDGLEILAEVRRRRPGLPVIVLTALGEVEQRVTGLDAGAADYLVKPFSLKELAARIRAQLRIADQAPSTAVRVGALEVDLLERTVRHAGEPLRLTTTEFELLVYLLRNRGRVLSREQILRAVWGYEHDPGTNVVDVYIGYLRRKLAQPGRAAPISTVRSVGYRFDEVD